MAEFCSTALGLCALAAVLCGIMGNTRPLSSMAVALGVALILIVAMAAVAAIGLATEIVVLDVKEEVTGSLIQGVMVFMMAAAVIGPVFVFLFHLAYCAARDLPTRVLGRSRRGAAFAAAAIFIAAAILTSSIPN